MNTILEISNWKQLVRARSEGYDSLRIVVSEYNSDKLEGTKISVIDYNTNEVYFAAFGTDIHSTIIPETARMQNDDIITVLNNFGFNVRISLPIVLAEQVVEILKGLYASGYRYVYRDYIKCLYPNMIKTAVYVTDQLETRHTDKSISDIPNFVADEWDWVEPFKTYPIKDLIDTGTVNNGLPIRP